MSIKNKDDLAILAKMRKEGTEKIITKNNYEFNRLSGIDSEVVKFLHYNGIVLKPLIKFYHSQV